MAYRKLFILVFALSGCGSKLEKKSDATAPVTLSEEKTCTVEQSLKHFNNQLYVCRSGKLEAVQLPSSPAKIVYPAGECSKEMLGTVNIIRCGNKMQQKLTTGCTTQNAPGGALIVCENQSTFLASGARGAPGAKGAPGLTGPKGETGPDGLPGIPGDKGIAGTVVGPKGPVGATGPQGAAGPKGPTGDRGPTGEAGAKGERGPRGATGPQGPQGPQGPTGPQGAQGPQG